MNAKEWMGDLVRYIVKPRHKVVGEIEYLTEGNLMIQQRIQNIEEQLRCILGNCDKCGLVFLRMQLQRIKLNAGELEMGQVADKNKIMVSLDYCPDCIKEVKLISKKVK